MRFQTNTVEHAVVLGGSVAGLMAARVLSDFYEQVTIVDRDDLSGGPAARGGVPQSPHVHGILVRGREVMEDLFPGITEELSREGAQIGDALGDVTWCPSGRRLLSVPLGMPLVSASRVLIESVVRRRVAQLPNVLWREATAAIGLLHDDGRVSGARVRTRGSDAGECLESSLVVDASGRASKASEWLESMGYQPPPEERLAVGVSYATCTYRLSRDVMRGRVAIVMPRAVGQAKGAVAQALEGGLVRVSFTGYGKHAPQPEHAALAEHARSLAHGDIAEIVEHGEPVDAIRRFHITANVRRYFEKLERFPEGFIVMGDALCAFNPVYAQGMTVAALEAASLGKCLAQGAVGLPARFFSDISPVVSAAWQTAVANDLEAPGVEGRRTWATRVVNRWMRSVLSAAEHDPWLSRTFVRIANLVDPMPVLFSRRAVRSVAAHWRARARDAVRSWWASGLAATDQAAREHHGSPQAVARRD